MLRNLGAGFALLRLKRLAPDRFAFSFDQLATLVVLNLAVWAALDTLHAEVGSQLMLDGLYGWGFYVLLALFACACVARAYARDGNTRSILIPALSAAPYVLTSFWILGDLPWIADRPGLETAGAILYLILLGVRIIQAAFGVARARAVAVASVLIILAPWLLRTLDIDTRLWLTDDVEQTEPEADAAAESLLYDQPARIAAAVQHLAPRAPSRTNVFYVGFAGDGGQSVFRREALFAEQVFAQHFASGERSLELINDEDDRDSFPIASVSALKQSLKLIASQMNVETDVLVLMLTSHGSQDGLSVVNGGLPLVELAPEDLREALEESGIKWKVVVVSACYAGVFVDAVKGDDTLVVTAADSEHSSFGCDDDRDLTYFGEAFLKDAMPTARTVEEAFQKAVVLVRQRETTEHKTPSNPQMAVGVRIRGKLAEIETAGAQGTIVQNH